MNTTEQHPDLLHQVFFRWQGNTQSHRTGIAPVSYSCGQDAAWRLYEELAPLLRVEGGPDRPSLVRTVTSTGEVVLIHRTPSREPGGRPTTDCHALVGTPEQLTVSHCIALVSWKWPPKPESSRPPGDPRIGRVPLDTLRASWQGTLPRIRTKLDDSAPQLTEITAAVLRAPGRRLSIRAEQLGNPSHINPAPVLLWGLHEILGDGFLPQFTFATLDTTDEHRLGIVFVPEWRASAADDPLRTRIPLTDPPAPPAPPRDHAEAIAQELVHRYLSTVPGRGRGIAHQLAGVSWNPAVPAEERLHRIGALLRLRPDSTGPSPAPPAVPVPAPVPAPEARPVADDRRERPAGRTSGPLTPVGTPAWTPVDGARRNDEPFDQEAVPAPVQPAGTSTRPAGTGTGTGTGYQQEPETSVYADTPQTPPGPPDPPVPLPALAVPAPFSRRAHLRERLLQRPAADSGPESVRRGRAELLRIDRDTPHHTLLTLRHRLGRFPDQHLLDLLGQPGLRSPARHVLLQALADRSAHRTREDARTLCTRVLSERLYLYAEAEQRDPTGTDPGAEAVDETAVTTAAWLFAWAVAPYARDPEQRPGLDSLLHTIGTSPSRSDRALLLRISLAPYDGSVPDLPPRTWQKLVEYLDPETGREAAHHREQPRGGPPRGRPAPPGVPAARRPPDRSAGPDRSGGSNELLVLAVGASLILALIVLVVLLAG
ncbi:hypothetical protein [Kitasatospora sp. NPDC088346]|uniref:hypothetical protein n=1 Tax=Kitasatospora sp. NPDC088346 TaxID=3364073 RepID=UPI0037FF7935